MEEGNGQVVRLVVLWQCDFVSISAALAGVRPMGDKAGGSICVRESRGGAASSKEQETEGAGSRGECGCQPWACMGPK